MDLANQLQYAHIKEATHHKIPPRRRRRPPFSYSSLIAQAILDSPEHRLTLREVYHWIMERYPQLYKADDTGWQNTIRHNLSLNKCFKKVPRSDAELGSGGSGASTTTASKGKGGYWTIDPDYMTGYHDGVFTRGGVQKRRPGELVTVTTTTTPSNHSGLISSSPSSPVSGGGGSDDGSLHNDSGIGDIDIDYNHNNHHHPQLALKTTYLSSSSSPPATTNTSSLMTPPPSSTSSITSSPIKHEYNNNTKSDNSSLSIVINSQQQQKHMEGCGDELSPSTSIHASSSPTSMKISDLLN
ncbi:7091_t:CDS:2 [Entrophospora sp. SA101]|nr:7091_t:CDS:2 [Entrophospora sp. SA101]